MTNIPRIHSWAWNMNPQERAIRQQLNDLSARTARPYTAQDVLNVLRQQKGK